MTRYKEIEKEVKNKIEETKNMKKVSKMKLMMDRVQPSTQAKLAMLNEPVKEPQKKAKKAVKKAKDQRFNVKWLMDVLNGTVDAETVQVGSNVVETRLMTKNPDAIYSEGGPIRLVLDVLMDSEGQVRLTRCGKKSNGMPYFRLSTVVK